MNDWRVRTAFQSKRVTVLVVESVSLVPTTSPGACHLVAGLEPAAIVVSAGEGSKVFDPDGEGLTVEALELRLEGVAQAIRAALE